MRSTLAATPDRAGPGLVPPGLFGQKPISQESHEREADTLAAQWMHPSAGAYPHVSTQVPTSKTEGHPGTGGGQPLSPSVRAFFEPRTGHNLSHIRIHADEQAHRQASQERALAFADGPNLFFGRGAYAPDRTAGRHLIAHEIAHALTPTHVGRHRTVTPSYAQIQTALRHGTSVSQTEAHSVYVLLQGLSDTDLGDTINRMGLDDYLNRLMRHSSQADLVTFRDIIQRMLQWIQRRGVDRYGERVGLTRPAMAQRQARFMQAQNVAAARAAALASGSTTPPSAAAIAAQQATSVASTSIAPQAATLSVADEATQTTAANAAKTTFITWVTANHPTLGITAANIDVRVREVFDRGDGVLAFGRPGKAVVGNDFAQAVAVNPAYALAVIVHELFGHPNYGPYGTAGSELGLELYDQAAPQMAGYTQPTGAGRTAEKDAYGYQETEIYSYMISLPFFTPVSAADATAHPNLPNQNFDPGPAIETRISLIKSQFQERVAQALVRGLVLRFRADPRIRPTSLAVFEAAIRRQFSRHVAGVILH